MNSADGRTYRWAWRLWLATLMLPGLGCLALGLWLIVDDLRTSGEFLDGIGIAIGVVMIGMAAVALILIGFALWLSGRHPRRAVIVAGVLAAAVGLALLVIFGRVASTVDLIFLAATLLWLAGFVSLSSTAGRWPTT